MTQMSFSMKDLSSEMMGVMMLVIGLVLAFTTLFPVSYTHLMYWDDEDEPSVESPLGDFFCCGFGRECNINSMPIAVVPVSYTHLDVYKRQFLSLTPTDNTFSERRTG